MVILDCKYFHFIIFLQPFCWLAGLTIIRNVLWDEISIIHIFFVLIRNHSGGRFLCSNILFQEGGVVNM